MITYLIIKINNIFFNLLKFKRYYKKFVRKGEENRVDNKPTMISVYLIFDEIYYAIVWKNKIFNR